MRNGVGLAGCDYHGAVRQLCNRIRDGVDPFAASVQPLLMQYRIDLRRQRRLPSLRLAPGGLKCLSFGAPAEEAGR